MNSKIFTVFAAAAPALLMAGTAWSQGDQIEGRGWDFPHLPYEEPFDGFNEQQFVGSTVAFYSHEAATATGGDVPAGIDPLDRDIFTSTDFYLDRDLWTDPRYYRCNAPNALDSQWGDFGSAPQMIENDDPATGAWGHCDRGLPREALVSPYDFETAQEHYEFLLDQAESRGEMTPSTEFLASLNKRYTRPTNIMTGPIRAGQGIPDMPENYYEPPQWLGGWATQTSTIMEVLTPQYQQSFVQQLYHKSANDAAQWSAMFCRPEGFLRWWSIPGGPGQLDVLAVDGRVTFLGGGGNAARNVYTGRDFNMEGATPRLGPDLPQWLGETVGFWDGEALISWTSNVQGWFTHGMFEHSSAMQTIEIWEPRYDDDGALVGLEHETIFYDPEALVEPIRALRFFPQVGDFNEVLPINQTYCQQNIFLDDSGHGVAAQPGQVVSFEYLDPMDRPWARVWEAFFEDGMERPEEDASHLFGF